LKRRKKMIYENEIHDEERSFYGLKNATIKNCKIDGPADGESAFKECRGIQVENTYFNLRYPFWHNDNVKITDCEMTENCRAALWYDKGVDIENCKMECDYSKAREKAFDMLSGRSLSKKELCEKLSRKGYDEAVVVEVANELEELGYINDYDYAMLFMEHCREKMWGSKKIRYEMNQRGISNDIIEEILSECNEYDMLDEIKEIIISRYSSRDLTDMKTKASAVRYFASRGFDFSLINSAISAAIEELANE